MRVIHGFIAVLLISNFAAAKVTCNSLYSISIEKNIQKIILDQKVSPEQKAKKVHESVIKTLKQRKISYRTLNIDGAQIIVIQPSKSNKLGRFASYLERHYQTKLAFSLEMTGKIDAGLYMGDQAILLTSIQDILRGDIGAATRHELSHLWEQALSDLDMPHPVFNTSIRSKSPLFDTDYMSGYEHYITYGEVHAYSRELHYSLWKLRHTSDPEVKKMIELDIEEAYNRLKEITDQLYKKTNEVLLNLKKYQISEDDFAFYIKGSDWTMSLEKEQPKLKDQLKIILEHLDKLQQKLERTKRSELEVILKEYISSL